VKEGAVRVGRGAGPPTTRTLGIKNNLTQLPPWALAVGLQAIPGRRELQGNLTLLWDWDEAGYRRAARDCAQCT